MPDRLSDEGWTETMADPVQIAEQFKGHASRDFFIVAKGYFDFSVEAPESGHLWKVASIGYLFEGGFERGCFFVRRNSDEIRTSPCRADSVHVLCSWGPNTLIVHIVHTMADAVVGHEVLTVSTPTTIPPNALVTWARKQCLVETTHYENEADFQDVVLMSFSTLEETIAATGSQRSFWDTVYSGNTITSRKPKKERECQNQLHALLRGVEIQKSLDIDREHVIGSGKVDFLIRGVLNNHSVARACVECKVAHSDRLEHGLVHQLPAYMRGLGCDYGIYLVLYFSCAEFSEPDMSVPDLMSKLHAWKTEHGLWNIHPIIVDCTRPTPPSEL